MELPKSNLVKSQKKILEKDLGDAWSIKVEIRYDDECGNGHNSFAITGTLYQGLRWDSCGSIHEEIVKHFPELEKYIKWHLTSSDGPMHYVANTTYHASDRDYNGLLKGEVHQWDTKIKFGDFPITFKLDKAFREWIRDRAASTFKIVEVPYVPKDRDYKFRPKYSFEGYTNDWYKCPFDDEPEALEFLETLQKYPMNEVKIPSSWGEGKERELDAARRSAVWPEATDEQLCLPKEELEKLLLDRLPALMLEFKRDMEELGFEY